MLREVTTSAGARSHATHTLRSRKGYLDWRNALYAFHGAAVAEIMEQVGYDESVIVLTRRILSKQSIKADSDAQTFEDAVGLTFLELRLEGFIDTVTDAQLTRALNRTWQKMSEEGHGAALGLQLEPRCASVLQRIFRREKE